MAKFQQARVRTFVAGADLSAKKYFGVKLDTTVNQVVLAGAGEAEFVLLNSPKSGEAAECAMLGGGAMGISGAAIAIGAEVASNAAGKLITALSGNKVIGIAIEAAAATDQYFEIERVRYVKA